MLNQQQRDTLRKMPGFDQTLLNTYEANNPLPAASDTVNTGATTVDPNAAVNRVSQFNSALNVAIDKARGQRKDSTLDMIGGMIPSGALPATSFASVLSAFDADSAPLEASLIDNASEFAIQQEKRIADTKLEISDLALKVGANGGSQDTVNAILALMDSGDIAGAVRIAATGLAKKGVTEGGNGTLVDKEGNPVWEISNQELWQSGKAGPIFEASKFNNEFDSTKVTSSQELNDEMSRLMGDKKLKVHALLKNDGQRREFMNDWVEYQEFVQGGPIDPMVYLPIWSQQKGLDLMPKKDDKKGDEDEEKDLFDEVYGE